ncbi:jg6335 [Pararge aegeria aegeria]|uniref:Jg6335 protein n=1 Tax=Pararge aegeria aegeria TaxID=348720 RepID=A0A8S4RPD8_9NEOP|nr:jg6335 [Pararge aegeria aegeria]
MVAGQLVRYMSVVFRHNTGKVNRLAGYLWEVNLAEARPDQTKTNIRYYKFPKCFGNPRPSTFKTTELTTAPRMRTKKGCPSLVSKSTLKPANPHKSSVVWLL